MDAKVYPPLENTAKTQHPAKLNMALAGPPGPSDSCTTCCVSEVRVGFQTVAVWGKRILSEEATSVVNPSLSILKPGTSTCWEYPNLPKAWL